jgi:hypothetical protein
MNNKYAALTAPREVVESIRRKAGATVQDILIKEGKLNIYELLGAIEVLVGWKLFKQMETSPAERMVFSVTWLAREVGTGGFRQYFINSAGDFWEDVLNGLVAIDDRLGEQIFRQALAIFPKASPSKERMIRVRQLDSLEAENPDVVTRALAEVTDRYFDDPFPKWELVFAYVKIHSDEFHLHHV